MEGKAVVALFDTFANSQVAAWAAGGWAVDAVVGRQTRAHNDLDLAVDIRDMDSALAALTADGFITTVDWSPVRLELTAPDGGIVDLHPVTFAADGSAVQAGFGGESFRYSATGFTVGSIEGHTIPCLTARQQLQFRRGYDARPVDSHDIRLLEQFIR